MINSKERTLYELEEIKSERNRNSVSKVLYKTKRMHIYVSDEFNELIRNECARQGITISEYIINKALSSDISEISNQLESIMQIIEKLQKKKVLKMSTNLDNSDLRNKSNSQRLRKPKGLHIRMTEEEYEKMMTKASKHSMSLSDYIGFTVADSDIENISKKVNAIYNILIKTFPDAVEDTIKEEKE